MIVSFKSGNILGIFKKIRILSTPGYQETKFSERRDSSKLKLLKSLRIWIKSRSRDPESTRLLTWWFQRSRNSSRLYCSSLQLNSWKISFVFLNFMTLIKMRSSSFFLNIWVRAKESSQFLNLRRSKAAVHVKISWRVWEVRGRRSLTAAHQRGEPEEEQHLHPGRAAPADWEERARGGVGNLKLLNKSTPVRRAQTALCAHGGQGRFLRRHAVCHNHLVAPPTTLTSCPQTHLSLYLSAVVVPYGTPTRFDMTSGV